MTAAVVPLKLKPVPVSDHSSAKLRALDLKWPHMVPSAKSAVVLMFDPTRLPPSLHVPTLQLLRELDARGASAPPEGAALDQWLHAQAVLWRLTVADALAQNVLTHDEAALQAMFDEAAEVREWLLKLGQPEAMELRGLLQKAWSDVLAHAPPPPGDAPQRPAAKTGHTRIGPMPTRPTARAAVAKPAFDDLDAKPPLGRYALAVLLAALVAARLLFVEPDLEASAQAVPLEAPVEAPVEAPDDARAAASPTEGAPDVP